MQTISPAATLQEESLTDRVIRYQRTGSGFAELIRLIAPRIYNFPKRMRTASEDDCGDFYCYFIPRVPRIIDRFVFRGIDFEIFLNSSMKWQYKSFVSRCVKRNLSLATVKHEEFWPNHDEYGDPALVCERPEVTPRARKKLGVNATGIIENPVIARRVLLLTLKASQEIGSDTVSRAAELIGADGMWLSEKVQELNARLAERRERREKLRRRRDHAYFRMCYFQKKIASELDEPSRTKYTRLMRAEREHLANARDSLSRVPVTPTHRDIASILDMPKGSVDSALYYIRNSCRDLDSDIDDGNEGSAGCTS